MTPELDDLLRKVNEWIYAYDHSRGKLDERHDLAAHLLTRCRDALTPSQQEKRP